ncbi:lactate racemase domain-containing protein [Streptomyces sp. B21-083]
MFGDEIVDGVRIVNHDARDLGQLTWMGTYGDGVPVWLNREWVEADVRITTGFVEPHFFAGFSGGPKLVAPGLAALETLLVLHDAARQSPEQRLLDRMRAIGPLAVAYSGGADFALVLAAAVRALGANRVLAVTAVSESLADGELDRARLLADDLGVTHLTPRTRELARPGYRANGPDRC